MVGFSTPFSPEPLNASPGGPELSQYLQRHLRLISNTFGLVKFDVLARLSVDPETGTIVVDLNSDTGVELPLGLESLYHVKNQTGSEIAKGTLVGAAGALGASGRIKVAPFTGNGTQPSQVIMGLAAEAIPNGMDGYIVAFGKVRQVNTTGASVGEVWADGDILWAHPTQAGKLTKVEPTAPNNKSIIALVVYAHSNGTLFVRPTFGQKLTDLEDVAAANPVIGDFLQFNGTTWARKAAGASGSFTAASGQTVTVVDGLITGIV
jgi:hypothetical protein